MPFCPSCGNEYEAEVDRCAECDEALVAERQEPAPAASGMVLCGADGGVAEYMLEALRGASIPSVRLDEEEAAKLLAPGMEEIAGVVVPLPFLANAVRTLEEDPRLVAGEETDLGEGRIVFRFFDAERDDEIRTDPLLETARSAAVSLSQEQLERLGECVQRGTRGVAERAIALLSAAGSRGIVQLNAALAAAIAGGERILAAQICRALGAGGAASQGEEVDLSAILAAARAGLRSERAASRSCAALVAGELGLAELAPLLIDLLGDVDAEVAVEADEALIGLSGDDLGFEPEMEEEERRAQIEMRRTWWREQEAPELGGT